MTSEVITINERVSGLSRLARLLMYGNIMLFILEYFALSSYRMMHPESVWYDAGRMSLCIIDVVAAFSILKGWVVPGIAAIGVTSLIMFLLPSTADASTYSWPSVIASVALFFWDFIALIWLARRQRA